MPQRFQVKNAKPLLIITLGLSTKSFAKRRLCEAPLNSLNLPRYFFLGTTTKPDHSIPEWDDSKQRRLSDNFLYNCTGYTQNTIPNLNGASLNFNTTIMPAKCSIMMDIDVEEQPDDAVSSEGILPKLIEASSSLDQLEAAKQGRGMAKSGRWWKTVRKERSSGIVKVKPLKSSWKQKMKQKADFEQIKKLVDEIRQKQAAEKAAKLEAKKERERRREENARRAEIVQVIKNTHKLKRAKKKQLRRIEKRDTN